MPDALTPHGELLERARGGLSKREAARRADISEGRWRQIVTGVQKAGGGVSVPVNPRPTTLVAMARAVGADERAVLAAAGFEDAEVAEEERPLRGYPNAVLLSELAWRLGQAQQREDVTVNAQHTAPTSGPVTTGSTREQLQWDRHAAALQSDRVRPLTDAEVVDTLGPRPPAPAGEVGTVTPGVTPGHGGGSRQRLG